MYFDKRRYKVPIVGGKGSFNTDSLRGMVVHLLIRPESRDTIWDLTVLDKEQDEIMEIDKHVGRLDDKWGMPLGKDAQEIITFHFSNVSKNEVIKVILKTREIE